MKRTLFLFSLLSPIVLLAQVVNKPKVALRNWATGLNEPVNIINCGDDRLFVLERAGRIKIISDSMVVGSRPFLDISGPVQSGGGEQGLLGLAFDPAYFENGFFYTYYIAGSGSGISRISRWSVSNDPDSADLASEQVLFEWPQPYSNHNGGDLHFGPDGYLYHSFGDGGSGNDPEDNGQDYSQPLGGMIRIDVSAHDDSYLIPPTNPFATTISPDTMPEVWAKGLRNPYRWSFDRLTGDVWIGDVGQNAWEEVDRWPAGDNSCPDFGWRCREGLVATPGVAQDNCLGAGAYVSPLAVFNHTNQGWCSVIGGYVYRGSWYPHHYGHYIFTDYCAGDFLTFSDDTYTDVDTMLMTSTSGYAGFGEDVDGQLYVVDQLNGLVKKLYDPCPMDDPTITSDGDLLTATEGNSYQWFLNGQQISGATNQTYLAEVSGDYQVRVNFGSPCNLYSDTLTFVVSGIPGSDRGGLALFPQPARDLVTVERANTSTTLNVALYNALGRAVRTTTWAQGRRQLVLNVADLPPGSYALRCADQGTDLYTARLVIAR